MLLHTILIMGFVVFVLLLFYFYYLFVHIVDALFRRVHLPICCCGLVWIIIQVLQLKQNRKPSQETGCRDQSRYEPSQWETSLQCNDVFHWLGAYLDWSLWLFAYLSVSVIGYFVLHCTAMDEITHTVKQDFVIRMPSCQNPNWQ